MTAAPVAPSPAHAAPWLVQLPDVDEGGTQPPGTEGLTTMLNWLIWGGFAAALAGVIVAGLMMAIQISRHGSNEGVTRLGWALGGAVTVAAATGLVGALI